MRIPHRFESSEIPLIVRLVILLLLGLYFDGANHLLRIGNALIILIPQVATLVVNNNQRIVYRNGVILILLPSFFSRFRMMRQLGLIHLTVRTFAI